MRAKLFQNIFEFPQYRRLVNTSCADVQKFFSECFVPLSATDTNFHRSILSVFLPQPRPLYFGVFQPQLTIVHTVFNDERKKKCGNEGGIKSGQSFGFHRPSNKSIKDDSSPRSTASAWMRRSTQLCWKKSCFCIYWAFVYQTKCYYCFIPCHPPYHYWLLFLGKKCELKRNIRNDCLRCRNRV